LNNKILKIAVLGAGNIGRFHIREFISAGAEPVAVLGKTEDSARKKVQSLNSEFGLKLKAYSDLGQLIKKEDIDAVSICTPPILHAGQADACLKAGLNVICEKPFVQDGFANNYPRARQLADLAKNNRKVLTVNTQWPAMLEQLAKQFKLTDLKSFSVFSQPGEKDANMLPDHLPHANSMLLKLIFGGKAENIVFKQGSNRDIQINFDFVHAKGSCEVTYRFKFKADRPRKLKFTFNGREFTREIDENYRQRLISGSERLDIEDPLKVSISRFILAVRGLGKPLISAGEMLKNAKLQDQITAGYLNFIKPGNPGAYSKI
jgi:predicted dehydrogenase